MSDFNQHTKGNNISNDIIIIPIDSETTCPAKHHIHHPWTHLDHQDQTIVITKNLHYHHRNHLSNHLCHHLKLTHLPLHHHKNPSQRAVQRGSPLVHPMASKRELVVKSNLFRPRNSLFQVIIWPQMVLHRHLERGAAERCACLGDTETDNFPGFSNE